MATEDSSNPGLVPVSPDVQSQEATGSKVTQNIGPTVPAVLTDAALPTQPSEPVGVLPTEPAGGPAAPLAELPDGRPELVTPAVAKEPQPMSAVEAAQAEILTWLRPKTKEADRLFERKKTARLAEAKAADAAREKAARAVEKAREAAQKDANRVAKVAARAEKAKAKDRPRAALVPLPLAPPMAMLAAETAARSVTIKPAGAVGNAVVPVPNVTPPGEARVELDEQPVHQLASSATKVLTLDNVADATHVEIAALAQQLGEQLRRDWARARLVPVLELPGVAQDPDHPRGKVQQASTAPATEPLRATDAIPGATPAPSAGLAPAESHEDAPASLAIAQMSTQLGLAGPTAKTAGPEVPPLAPAGEPTSPGALGQASPKDIVAVAVGGSPKSASPDKVTSTPAFGLLQITIVGSDYDTREIATLSSQPQDLYQVFKNLGCPVGQKNFDKRIFTDADGRKAHLTAWIPGAIRKGGTRCDKDIESISAIVLDFDNKKGGKELPLSQCVTIAQIASLVLFLKFIHTSYSHRADHPTFRLVIPLARPVDVQTYRKLWNYFFNLTGGTADVACSNPSHFYYLLRSKQESFDNNLPRLQRWDGPVFSAADAADIPEVASPLRVASNGSISKLSTTLVQAPGRKSGRTRFEAHLLVKEIVTCSAVRWAIEDPSAASYETWRGIATNLACAASGHDDVLAEALAEFDALSAADENRYNANDVLKAWMWAVASANSHGAMTFSHMVENGLPEEHRPDNAATLFGLACKKLAAKKRMGIVKY